MVKSHYIRWFDSVTAKKTTHGDVFKAFNLTALLMMFANSKRLTLEDIVKILYDKENPGRLLSKNIISAFRIGYVQKIVVDLIKGRPPILDKHEIYKKF